MEDNREFKKVFDAKMSETLIQIAELKLSDEEYQNVIKILDIYKGFFMKIKNKRDGEKANVKMVQKIIIANTFEGLLLNDKITKAVDLYTGAIRGSAGYKLKQLKK